MKYVVQLNEDRKSVTVEADGLRYEAEAPVPRLSDIEGSPVAWLRSAPRLSRRRPKATVGAAITLWVDGYRFETEALDERNSRHSRSSALARGRGSAGAHPGADAGMIVRVSVKRATRLRRDRASLSWKP